jgi:hypothetical protein
MDMNRDMVDFLGFVRLVIAGDVAEVSARLRAKPILANAVTRQRFGWRKALTRMDSRPQSR